MVRHTWLLEVTNICLGCGPSWVPGVLEPGAGGGQHQPQGQQGFQVRLTVCIG